MYCNRTECENGSDVCNKMLIFHGNVCNNQILACISKTLLLLQELKVKDMQDKSLFILQQYITGSME